jgi:hypothetical protein
MYFVINEIPQGNLSIIVRPKGLHINQPKVEIKFGHGVMGQASSFDDRLSGKAQTRGKTGGTSLTSLKYPDVCPLPASRFGAEAISFFAGRQESERADHPCAMGFVYTLSRFPPKEKAALTEDNMYFVINEIPQGNLSIIVRPKGLHINQPKVEIKFGHGVMGQASSFDDRLSGKAQTRGKTGGTSLTSLKYPDVCPLPASRFGAEAISFFAGRQESERARSPMRHGLCLHAEPLSPKGESGFTAFLWNRCCGIGRGSRAPAVRTGAFR